MEHEPIKFPRDDDDYEDGQVRHINCDVLLCHFFFAIAFVVVASGVVPNCKSANQTDAK